jgi:hypothetical protein
VDWWRVAYVIVFYFWSLMFPVLIPFHHLVMWWECVLLHSLFVCVYELWSVQGTSVFLKWKPVARARCTLMLWLWYCMWHRECRIMGSHIMLLSGRFYTWMGKIRRGSKTKKWTNYFHKFYSILWYLIQLIELLEPISEY